MATRKPVHPPEPPSQPHDLHYDLQVCHVRLRRGLAGNPNTPADALTTLATDKSKDVRYDVARNPNTPVSVLTTLATDPDVFVRWRVLTVALFDDVGVMGRDDVGGFGNAPPGVSAGRSSSW